VALPLSKSTGKNISVKNGLCFDLCS